MSPPVSPAPAAAPPDDTPAPIRLRPLKFLDPLRWLRAGAADLTATPLIGAFYGLAFWMMALLLGWVFRTRPWMRRLAMHIGRRCAARRMEVKALRRVCSAW